jgi:hypothetical protein
MSIASELSLHSKIQCPPTFVKPTRPYPIKHCLFSSTSCVKRLARSILASASVEYFGPSRMTDPKVYRCRSLMCQLCASAKLVPEKFKTLTPLICSRRTCQRHCHWCNSARSGFWSIRCISGWMLTDLDWNLGCAAAGQEV